MPLPNIGFPALNLNSSRGETDQEREARQRRQGGSWGQALEKGYSNRALANRFIDAQNQMGATGPAAESYGYDQLKSFDPRAAFKEYTTGAYNDFHNVLGTELEKLAGRDSAAGRLNTGFFDQDQGELARNIASDYTNRVQQAALQTGQMEQNRRGALLDYGVDANNRYLDLLTGNSDRIDARENARKASKGSGLGGLIGGLAGSFLGPLGSAAGSKLGSKLF